MALASSSPMLIRSQMNRVYRKGLSFRWPRTAALYSMHFAFHMAPEFSSAENNLPVYSREKTILF